mgnify:CR=1 FL=1
MQRKPVFYAGPEKILTPGPRRADLAALTTHYHSARAHGLWCQHADVAKYDLAAVDQGGLKSVQHGDVGNLRFVVRKTGRDEFLDEVLALETRWFYGAHDTET